MAQIKFCGSFLLSVIGIVIPKNINIMVLETIKNNKITISITVISVIAIFSTVFLYRFFPSLFPRDILLIYLIAFTLYFAVVALFCLISAGLFLWPKKKKKSQKKITLVGVTLFLSTILIAPLSLALLHALPKTLPSGSDKKAFNSDLWKLESSTDWNDGISIREQMLKDVVENILPEKTKEEIQNQLGASLETDYFRSYDKDLLYYLGPERDGLITIDSEWLLIWLDDSGKFERYKIVND